MANNHWSVPSAFNAPPTLTPLALWVRQFYEGVSFRVPFEASRRFLFYDEYYGNWRTWNMPSTRIVVVNPCRRCKTLAYSWLQHQLIFLPHQYIYIYIFKWYFNIDLYRNILYLSLKKLKSNLCLLMNYYFLFGLWKLWYEKYIWKIDLYIYLDYFIQFYIFTNLICIYIYILNNY